MSMFEWMLRNIHAGKNPYEGFDPSSIEHKLEGWDSEHLWFGEAIREFHSMGPLVIIEVGTFLGGSAIHMAKWLRDLEIDGCVICVDTWLGDRQLWLREEHRKTMGFRNGRPELYEKFLANVYDSGLQNYIIPLPMHSTGGARYLNKFGIHAPLIYIDGCHDEDDVYLDLKLYWDLLAGKGTMLIDDYVPNTNNNEMFWGVIRDVDRFAKQRGLVVENLGRKARLKKPILPG